MGGDVDYKVVMKTKVKCKSCTYEQSHVALLEACKVGLESLRNQYRIACTRPGWHPEQYIKKMNIVQDAIAKAEGNP